MHRDSVEAAIVASMKIVVLSKNGETARLLRGFFKDTANARGAKVVEGGVEQARLLADQERPDCMVIEATRHDAAELLTLEQLALSAPGMPIVLISGNQSADYLRLGMRIGLREILPTPLSLEALLATISRFQQRAIAVSRPRSGGVYCFVGCKGGSGTTFLAANLGYALAGAGKTVALIDLNTEFGDAAMYISDRTPRYTLTDVARQVDRLDGIFLASSMLQVLPKLHVLAAPEDADQTLHLRAEQIDAVLSVAASHYDVVVVDAGRSLNEITLRAMDRADTIFAVLQQSLPFIRDAQRLLRALTGLGYSKSKVQLIINRFDKKGIVGTDEIVGSLRHEVYRRIPNSFETVSASINQGIPILQLASRDPVSRSLEEMAGVLAGVKKDTGGWLTQLWASR